MNLYYAAYSGDMHHVDFELSTDTPYDMAKHWPGRTTAYRFVRDNKRLLGTHPDIATWYGSFAAIVGYDSPPIGQICLTAADNSAVITAIKTRDGICAVYRYKQTWGLAHITSHYTNLLDVQLRDIKHIPNHGPVTLTTDLYTDKLVYRCGAYMIKDNIARYYVGPQICEIASAGSVDYVVDGNQILMYDDRLDERQNPVALCEFTDNRAEIWCRMRMLSDSIIAIGSANTAHDALYAYMTLFDVRSPGSFAAEPPPVRLSVARGVSQLSL